MATQRYVSTSFWDDEWIQTLDPSEKLLYLYLMTGPLTNIAGIYKLSSRRICFDTGFNQDTIGHIFNKFETMGKAFRIGEYVVIPSWPKHQKWEKAPKIRDGIISILQDIPNDLLHIVRDLGYQFDLSIVDSTIIAYKTRKDISGTTVKRVYEKFGYCCSRCKSPLHLNIHHVKSVKDGGGNNFENLELLCVSCHKKEHSPDRVYGPETNSEYPPNYSDSDSDSDYDLSTDRNDEAPPSPEPKPPKAKKKASSMPKVIDPLYHPIEQSFLSQGRFTNYEKEGALIKGIIKGIRNLDPDDPEGAARKILETFRTLTAGNERFWREQPFTPSGLSPNLARVWAIVQKSEPRQEDWFENLQGGGSVSDPIPFR